MSDHKTISIEEALIPINAKLFGDNFDPRFQTVHAFDCGGGDICVSEELYQAMCNHFAATDDRLERERDEALDRRRQFAERYEAALGREDRLRAVLFTNPEANQNEDPAACVSLIIQQHRERQAECRALADKLDAARAALREIDMATTYEEVRGVMDRRKAAGLDNKEVGR